MIFENLLHVPEAGFPPISSPQLKPQGPATPEKDLPLWPKKSGILHRGAAEAARNTGNLISEAVSNTQHGVEISIEVAESLKKIAEGAQKVNEIAAGVASSSGEQSTLIDQVNNAVAEMDKVTQQNAANSEETASVAEQLNAQAEQMSSVVKELAMLIGMSGSASAEKNAMLTR